MKNPSELIVEWFHSCEIHTLPDDVKRKNEIDIIPEGVQ